MQQLHDQMRLAIGGAARHRGADAGRDRGIEEIDVEADMQHAVARLDPFDHPPDQHADAELVDRAHVGDGDAALAHQFALQRIDRADAEQIELIGTRWRRAADRRASRRGRARRTGTRPTCRACCRSGSSPACCSRHGRRPTARTAAGPFCLPVARDAVHRSHRQAVIAAHEDRDRAGARQLESAFAERADPALDLVVDIWRWPAAGRRPPDTAGTARSP